MGKTALAREAGRWWQRTGLFERAVFISFDRPAPSRRPADGRTLEGADFTAAPRPRTSGQTAVACSAADASCSSGTTSSRPWPPTRQGDEPRGRTCWAAAKFTHETRARTPAPVQRPDAASSGSPGSPNLQSQAPISTADDMPSDRAPACRPSAGASLSPVWPAPTACYLLAAVLDLTGIARRPEINASG